MQSVPFTTKFGEVLSIQIYMIKFGAGRGFSIDIPGSSTNISDRYDITDISLKEVLTIVAITLPSITPMYVASSPLNDK